MKHAPENYTCQWDVDRAYEELEKVSVLSDKGRTFGERMAARIKREFVADSSDLDDLPDLIAEAIENALWDATERSRAIVAEHEGEEDADYRDEVRFQHLSGVL